MVKKLQYLIAFSWLLAVLAGFTTHQLVNVNVIKTIVIDPGHGGKDPGCQGVSHKEKEVSLAVALRLGKMLKENFKDIKVIYTRTTDVFVDLEERAQIANRAKADLFISIHCNAAGKPVMITDPKTGKKRAKTFRNSKGKLVVVETANPVPYGSETYVMGLKNEEGKMKVATRENSAIFYEEDYQKKYGGFDPESEESYIIMSNYTSAYVIQSANLAMKIQEEYAKKAGRVNKGVHRQSIWVLWRTSMPSILTELGYLTNPLEEKFLGSEKGQDYMAKAIFRGVRKYKDEVEGKKIEYNDEYENQEPLENENLLALKTAGDEPDEDPKTNDTLPVKTATPAVEKTKSAEKQKVNDSGDVEITIKEPEEEKASDTALSAPELAKKFSKTKGSDISDEIFFKVQFASTDVQLNLKQGKFSDIRDADFYKMNNVLKYTSGKFRFFKDAIEHQSLLRSKGFKDCFVIAMKNGQRIDVAEAKRLSGQ